MGVFDGVGGVSSIGLDPAAMAHDLNMRIPTEMELRLSHNAQRYDRDTQLSLATSAAPNNGGWLRNLCALSFLKTDTLGSTTLGVCHVSGLLIQNKHTKSARDSHKNRYRTHRKSLQKSQKFRTKLTEDPCKNHRSFVRSSQ